MKMSHLTDCLDRQYLPNLLITTQQTKHNKVVCTLLRLLAASTQHITEAVVYKVYIHDGLMGHAAQLIHFPKNHDLTIY